MEDVTLPFVMPLWAELTCTYLSTYPCIATDPHPFNRIRMNCQQQNLQQIFQIPTNVIIKGGFTFYFCSNCGSFSMIINYHMPTNLDNIDIHSVAELKNWFTINHTRLDHIEKQILHLKPFKQNILEHNMIEWMEILWGVRALNTVNQFVNKSTTQMY